MHCIKQKRPPNKPRIYSNLATIKNSANLKQKDPQVMYKSAFSDILSTIAI